MMRRSNWNLTKLLLLPMLLILSAGAVFAQNTNPSASPPSAASSASDQDPLLKGCEQAADLLKFERGKSAGLQEKVDGLLAQIDLYKQLAANEHDRAELYKTAAAERATANGLDTEIRANAAHVETLLNQKYDAMKDDRDRLLDENRRLRNPPFWKSLFDPKNIAFGLAGYGIGTVRH